MKKQCLSPLIPITASILHHSLDASRTPARSCMDTAFTNAAICSRRVLVQSQLCQPSFISPPVSQPHICDWGKGRHFRTEASNRSLTDPLRLPPKITLFPSKRMDNMVGWCIMYSIPADVTFCVQRFLFSHGCSYYDRLSRRIVECENF